ncbi:solute carrier family 22 member 2-like [Hemiscyllium ocellatum]|uniref:solute carrier family 22 member 2-like n=1 Tax=Hemiscyllium ocellatum TaxID=170820 RepID=UPI0029670876|nr:solute carrier family 22 member 2-like [Hemiscyllium ocellatum]
MATFDDVLIQIGGFGQYQKVIFFLIYLSSMMFSHLYFGFVFLAVTPDHWCRSPGVTELRDKCNWSLEQEKNYTLPVGQSGSSSYSQCEKYDIDWNSSSGSCENPLLFVQNGSQHLPRTTCQDGWVFENGSFPSIVTEFELVCADAWKVDLTQACLNVGFLFGTMIMGYAADIFGRKLCFLFATFVTTVSGLLLAFSPNYTWFVIFRTLQGLFSRGGWLCGYVLITELVVSDYRRTAGILNQVSFSFGIMLLPAIAYFLPAWRNLQLAITIPNFLFLTYYWLVPESPRWMFSQKKDEEAMKILQQVAKRNGHTFSMKAEVTSLCGNETETNDEKMNRPSITELVRTPQMRKHTLILMVNWFTSALVYQGLVMRLGTLGGNIYLDFFISGAVEIPASIIIILVIERIGRRFPFAAGGLVAGGSCLIVVFIPENLTWLKTAVACLGRLGITVALEMVCFVNMELYPTFLRNFAVAACGLLCDIGGVVSPFIVYRLAAIWIELPLVVFGVTGLIAGVLVLLLPETKGVPLPDTIEDAENIRRQRSQAKDSHVVVGMFDLFRDPLTNFKLFPLSREFSAMPEHTNNMSCPAEWKKSALKAHYQQIVQHSTETHNTKDTDAVKIALNS